VSIYFSDRFIQSATKTIVSNNFFFVNFCEKMFKRKNIALIINILHWQ